MVVSPLRAERVRQASRARRDKQKADLRDIILAAARAVFDEQGYEGFSLRQVAERIGYSATTIYLYYADKDALLSAILDEGFEQFLAVLQVAADAEPDPLARLAALGRAYVEFGLDHSIHYRLMFMQRSDLLLHINENCPVPRIASFQVLEDAVKSALEAGALRPGDPLAYARSVWALVHGITALTISMPTVGGREVARQTLDFAFGLLHHGMTTSPPATREPTMPLTQEGART